MHAFSARFFFVKIKNRVLRNTLSYVGIIRTGTKGIISAIARAIAPRFQIMVSDLKIRCKGTTIFRNINDFFS